MGRSGLAAPGTLTLEDRSARLGRRAASGVRRRGDVFAGDQVARRVRGGAARRGEVVEVRGRGLEGRRGCEGRLRTGNRDREDGGTGQVDLEKSLLGVVLVVDVRERSDPFDGCEQESASVDLERRMKAQIPFIATRLKLRRQMRPKTSVQAATRVATDPTKVRNLNEDIVSICAKFGVSETVHRSRTDDARRSSAS